MKKLLSVLVILALAGAAAFAEMAEPSVEATFSAKVFTGLYYNAGDGTVVAGDPDNFGDGASGLDLRGDFSYGDFGIKVFTRFSNIDDAFSTAKIKAAYSYFNFFENKLQFSAGVIGDTDFSTGYSGYDAFTGPGALIVAKPIPGLALAYLFPISKTGTILPKRALLPFPSPYPTSSQPRSGSGSSTTSSWLAT
jgi:hypothetical protein